MASLGGTARKRATPLPATSVQSPKRTSDRISSYARDRGRPASAATSLTLNARWASMPT